MRVEQISKNIYEMLTLYCALALGINPKHFILATMVDIKHSVSPSILSSFFGSHGRE